MLGGKGGGVLIEEKRGTLREGPLRLLERKGIDGTTKNHSIGQGFLTTGRS